MKPNEEIIIPQIIKYSNKGVIIDTNLLLLFLIGKYDIEAIAKFKNTYKFSKDDFWIVFNVLNKFKKIITTPHILTEISSLSRQLPNYQLAEYFKIFETILVGYFEIPIPKDVVLRSSHLCKYGVTDTGIIELAKSKEFLVFTEDFPLANYLQTRNVDVLNLNHIRTFLWNK